MTDYWILHGQHQVSAISIKARLKFMTLFLDHEADAGRLSDPFLPEQIDDQFLARFRAWAIGVPIVARKKDAAGHWVDGMSRKRSPATIEESVIQLKAAIKHAYDNRRIRYLPPIKHKTRGAVTAKRNDRMSLQAIGELLDYTMTGAGTYTTPARLLPLRRYIIAAICTVARPDAILDINVTPERGQWMPEAGLFDLNPAGRLQTNKRRPTLPVAPLLRNWLDATDEWFVCQERQEFDQKQQINVIEQIAVKSVRSAWDTAREALRIPAGRGPKYLRHSMATILANRGVPPDEISMVLGHRVLDQTTESYVIYDPGYLKGFRQGLDDVLADLMKMAGTALHAKLAQKHSNVTVLRA
ncbi:hypothetical protein V473_02635 [Sphingobium cupriresistens LL01]|uniref:Tyr recombinase domain-containing protein n=2 Tax=Sphingobium cupriresistens TaxID=1132417 RepID=A0A0J7Y453_9SPHN|nr:hypothetical protein V473_02635 [Sphingobium cupriresistens LL01]